MIFAIAACPLQNHMCLKKFFFFLNFGQYRIKDIGTYIITLNGYAIAFSFATIVESLSRRCCIWFNEDFAIAIFSSLLFTI